MDRSRVSFDGFESQYCQHNIGYSFEETKASENKLGESLSFVAVVVGVGESCHGLLR